MKTKLYVLILITVCLNLLACRGGKSCVSGQELGAKPRDRRTEATLCIDKGFYELGETVHIELTMRNSSKQSVVLQGTPVLNIVIKGGAPYQEQSWAAAHPEQAAALTHLELAPGETKMITWDWIPQQNNRDYGVHGYWKRTDGLMGELRRIVGVGGVLP